MKTFGKSLAVAIISAASFICCGTAEGQNVIELTSESFNENVYNIEAGELKYLGNKPAIVDFTATWCGPCRQIAPILEEIAKEYKDEIVVYKVDVDKCRDITTAFGIQSIPAVLYIPLDGEPSMTVGSRNKQKFKEEVEKMLLEK